MARLVCVLGAVLVLGGLAHSAGIVRFYVDSGVPEANRVLLDVWVAEAQLLAGGLYLAAYRARRTGAPWRALSVFGALAIMSLAVPMLPVLASRAPWPFRVPLIVYIALSTFILARAVTLRRAAAHTVKV